MSLHAIGCKTADETGIHGWLAYDALGLYWNTSGSLRLAHLFYETEVSALKSTLRRTPGLLKAAPGPLVIVKVGVTQVRSLDLDH